MILEFVFLGLYGYLFSQEFVKAWKQIMKVQIEWEKKDAKELMRKKLNEDNEKRE
jgi:hypothetical protein